MKLSVVIVSWNTRQLLRRCLESLYESLRGADFLYEVVIVDNASSDGSAEMVRSEFGRVRFLQNMENVGFARANNQAVRLCRGDLVLLLNPDTEVRPGAVRVLLDSLDRHPEAGAAGPRLVSADGTLQVSCYPAPTLFREFWRLFHLDAIRPLAIYPMHRWDLAEPRQVEVLQGACLLLRKDALLECGLLDESYFIYSEDFDLCFSLRRAGRKLFWIPASTVLHHGGQSTAQVKGPMFLKLYEGKVVYFRKHYGRWSAFAYKLILLAASLARQALGPLALFQPADSRRQAMVRNYRELVKALPHL